MKKIFILIGFWIVSVLVQAQELPFKNFSHAEGLPSTEVYDIFQDKNGCMWFATDRGIAQYNGYEFKTYETVHGLTDICVFDFFLQPSGQVWCSTYTNQLFYFENGKNKFIPYRYNKILLQYLKNGGLKNLVIKKILVDKDQTVYITDFKQTLKIDNKGKLTTFQDNEKYGDLTNFNFKTITLKNKQKLDYLTNKKSNIKMDLYYSNRLGIVSLKSNNRLIASDSIIGIYRRDKKIVNLFDSKMEFIDCGIYDNQCFWISYRANGVKVFSYNGKEVQHLLQNHSVTKIVKDCYGGIWISTLDAGVFYLKKNNLHYNNLKDLPIHSLSKDNQNNLYIGGYNGNVYYKNYYEKYYKTLFESSNKSPAYISYHSPTKNNYFFVNSKLYYNDKVFNPHHFFRTTDEKEGDYLLLFGFTAISLIDSSLNIFKEYNINAKLLDVALANKKYYVGTLFGLKKIHSNKQYAFKNPILNSRIEDIDFEKKKQILYMASLGKGVLVYNLKTQKAYSIDKSKGLSSNLVNEVYIQNENTIWACTNYGLNKISFDRKGKFKVTYITTGNGLPTDQIKKVEIIKDSIYIGTSKGLSTLAINDFDNLFKNKKYFLRLKEITVNSKEILLQDKLELAYYENDLTFFVEGVSFSSNSQIYYKYKMHGLDKEWHYTKNRKIIYQYLPPGEYNFTVQIIEDNKVLSKEKINLSVLVLPPFWKTSWFIILVIVILSMLIYLFFKIRVFTYNVDIVRVLLRLLIKKLTKGDLYYHIKEQGKNVKIKTREILYIKSSGNYIEIVTLNKSYTIREKIGEVLLNLPDPLEFSRIHRSYIIRIDKVEEKTKNSVFIKQEEIPVGKTYLSILDSILI